MGGELLRGFLEVGRTLQGRSTLGLPRAPLLVSVLGGTVVGGLLGVTLGTPVMVLGMVLGTAVSATSLAVGITVGLRQSARTLQASQAVRLTLAGARIAKLEEAGEPGRYLLGFRYENARLDLLDADGQTVSSSMKPPKMYQVFVYLRAGDLLDARAAQARDERGSVDVYGYLEKEDGTLSVELAGLRTGFPTWESQVISETPLLQE